MNNIVIACLLRNTSPNTKDSTEILIVEAEDGSAYYPHAIVQPDETIDRAAERAIFETCGLTIKTWRQIGEDTENTCLISEIEMVLPDKWRVTAGDHVAELVWVPLHQPVPVIEEHAFIQPIMLKQIKINY